MDLNLYYLFLTVLRLLEITNKNASKFILSFFFFSKNLILQAFKDKINIEKFIGI